MRKMPEDIKKLVSELYNKNDSSSKRAARLIERLYENDVEVKL